MTRAARARAEVPIATDVHTIADLLFMSDESLSCTPEDGARRARQQYG